MASANALQFQKNTTDSLREMGLAIRGDVNPANALTAHSYDMQNLFGEGDKVKVWNSDLMKPIAGMDDVKNTTVEGTVINVTQKLVTVRYEKSGWTECFSILDYLGKRVYPVRL